MKRLLVLLISVVILLASPAAVFAGVLNYNDANGSVVLPNGWSIADVKRVNGQYPISKGPLGEATKRTAFSKDGDDFLIWGYTSTSGDINYSEKKTTLPDIFDNPKQYDSPDEFLLQSKDGDSGEVTDMQTLIARDKDGSKTLLSYVMIGKTTTVYLQYYHEGDFSKEQLTAATKILDTYKLNDSQAATESQKVTTPVTSTNIASQTDDSGNGNNTALYVIGGVILLLVALGGVKLLMNKKR